MKKSLHNIKKEIQNLKDMDEAVTLDIILDFGSHRRMFEHSAEYPAFKEALDSLGGEETPENIERACQISGVNPSVVHLEETHLEYRISTEIPKKLAKKIVKNRKLGG